VILDCIFADPSVATKLSSLDECVHTASPLADPTVVQPNPGTGTPAGVASIPASETTLHQKRMSVADGSHLRRQAVETDCKNEP
jgi:hypothetical protein